MVTARALTIFALVASLASCSGDAVVDPAAEVDGGIDEPDAESPVFPPDPCEEIQEREACCAQSACVWAIGYRCLSLDRLCHFGGSWTSPDGVTYENFEKDCSDGMVCEVSGGNNIPYDCQDGAETSLETRGYCMPP